MACALKMFGILQPLHERIVQFRVVVHYVQIVGEAGVGGQRPTERGDTRTVRLWRLSVHIDRTLCSPLRDRMPFSQRLRQFCLAPVISEDHRHIVAQEVSKEFPIAVVNPVLDRNHSLAERWNGDLRLNLSVSFFVFAFSSLALLKHLRGFQEHGLWWWSLSHFFDWYRCVFS